MDDGFHASRKLLQIPKRARYAAVGLWTIAGSWCADQLTDGFIPDYMIRELGAPPSAPESLVSAGLWERAQAGYVFCNWHEYQPSKQDVDAERAASRERMREIRARRKGTKPQETGANGEPFGRTPPNCSENVRNPDPTRPDPVAKATDREASQAPPTPKKRGHRLPEGWAPNGDLMQSMSIECPHVDQRAELLAFVDYWKAQPGAKGVKLDWDATYRNWIRRTSNNAPRSANRSTERMAAGFQAMSGYSGPTEDPWKQGELEA